jgi:hypothetical protein
MAGLSGFAIVTARDLHSPSHVRLMTSRTPSLLNPRCLSPSLCSSHAPSVPLTPWSTTSRRPSHSYHYAQQRIPRARVLRKHSWRQESEEREEEMFVHRVRIVSSYRLTVAELRKGSKRMPNEDSAREQRSLIVGSINGVESLAVASACHTTPVPLYPNPVHRPPGPSYRSERLNM